MEDKRKLSNPSSYLNRIFLLAVLCLDAKFKLDRVKTADSVGIGLGICNMIHNSLRMIRIKRSRHIVFRFFKMFFVKNMTAKVQTVENRILSITIIDYII